MGVCVCDLRNGVCVQVIQKKRKKKSAQWALKVFTLTKGAVELPKGELCRRQRLALGFLQRLSARFLISINVPCGIGAVLTVESRFLSDTHFLSGLICSFATVLCECCRARQGNSCKKHRFDQIHSDNRVGEWQYLRGVHSSLRN